MYLTLIDYGIVILLLVLSGGVGIFQGFSKGGEKSARQFLIADGKMKVHFFSLKYHLKIKDFFQ